jgi:hypothetical protein
VSAPLKNIPASLSSAKPATRYRALCPLAVISLSLSVLSILTILADSVVAWTLISLIPIGGAIAGWRAMKQIAQSPTEWIGLRMAKIGLWLSVGLWLTCSFSAWWLYAGRVPAGYDRITFETIWGESSSPGRAIPQRVRDMQDKKVFIQGYMKPSRQLTGIKDFTLSPTSGECPFCASTTRGEMIRVALPSDMTTDFTTHLIGVAGHFQIHEDDPSGIPFSIEADLLR